jgi:putative oxidoreductase
MNTILLLDFLPRSHDIGLLLLRLWFGLTMAFNHGLAKARNFGEIAREFPDVLGFGSSTSLALVTFSELVCGVLVAIGLATRLALIPLIATMAVAFTAAHKMKLAPGEGSGELAFLYLGVFVTLFIAGAGRFSIDEHLTTPEPARSKA